MANLGAHYNERRLMGEAEEHANRALEIALGTGDDDTIARALNVMGIVLRGGARYDDAYPVTRQAYETACRIPGSRLKPVILANFAYNAMCCGMVEEAQQQLLEARSEFEVLGLRQEANSCTVGLACNYLRDHRPAEARREFTVALESLQQQTDIPSSGWIFAELVGFAESVGDDEATARMAGYTMTLESIADLPLLASNDGAREAAIARSRDRLGATQWDQLVGDARKVGLEGSIDRSLCWIRSLTGL
jgi:hypothetical protein